VSTRIPWQSDWCAQQAAKTDADTERMK